jgi:hypothetical protein
MKSQISSFCEQSALFVLFHVFVFRIIAFSLCFPRVFSSFFVFGESKQKMDDSEPQAIVTPPAWIELLEKTTVEEILDKSRPLVTVTMYGL